MVLQERQITLLHQYRDKSYVMYVLLERSFEFFSFVKSLCNIPLILTSSAMAILNSSSFDAEKMKTPNIIINGTTAMLLALIGNFKLSEKEQNFKALSIKFMKLTHKIEDDLTNNIETLEGSHIKEHVEYYDTLIEQIDYTFPHHVKNKVKNLYYGKRTLPGILNCEGTEFSIKPDIVNIV